MSSKIIKLNTKSCQSCYKCIRECPLKAIEFKSNLAQVIPDECVLCGRCVECCPQNAKVLRDDLDAVRELISGDKPVYLSLAPSWVGWWKGRSFREISGAFKKLGFAGVEETAIGAAESTRGYAELMKKKRMKNIIATACPSVVMLVERHYPQLIPLLATVSSPMMAHAKLMRETYGDIKVVFAGPCLAKMAEASDPLAGGMVNYALTFDSIGRWMQEQKVDPEETADPEARGIGKPVTRLYPEPTGILKTLAPADTSGYTPIAVDGPENCMDLMNSLSRDPSAFSGLFIEANMCAGGCMGGPIMRMHGINSTLAIAQLTGEASEIDTLPAESAAARLSHPRVFQNRKPPLEDPSEEDIRRVLESIGKFTPDDELNCSSCGYPTCREKAIAVLRGKADISMCMPFLKTRAENISSTVIEHSPNGIVAFDEDLCVIDINPRAEQIYGVSKADVRGTMIPEFYGDPDFEQARASGGIVEGKTSVGKRSVDKMVVFIKEHRMYLVFVKDITEEAKREEQLEEMRRETVGTAQKVIDKQMRVAQEIASLLGETTAETKVALTKLKRSMELTQTEKTEVGVG